MRQRQRGCGRSLGRGIEPWGTKVDELDVAPVLRREEEVLWLDIGVAEPLCVQQRDARRHVFEDGRGHRLRVGSELTEVVEELAAADKLHDDEKPRVYSVGAVVPCDVLGLAGGQDLDLRLDFIDVVLSLLKVDHLDRNDLAVARVAAAEDLAKGTLANALEAFVLFHGQCAGRRACDGGRAPRQEL